MCKFYNPAPGGIKGCGLWAWVDNPQVEWQKHVINHVVHEKNTLQREVDILKIQVEALEGERIRIERKNLKLCQKVEKMNAGQCVGGNCVSKLCFFVMVVVSLVCLVVALCV